MVDVAEKGAGVLTVAKVTSSAATGYAKYLEGRAQAREAGDYYLSEAGERVEAPGRWVLGKRGAQALGVDPERVVDGEAFGAVMAVRHPESGGMLRRVGGNGEAVCAIDATFSAPKSVSVVWALAGPELRAGIEAAQEAAVDRALAYATEQVEMTRRRVDQRTVVRERAVEVLASSWRHTTARAVAGRAPDPQLHSHTLIHGAIRGDGELVAVDSRSWFVHQRELDAAYLSELAVGLERLGFAVERETGRRQRYFELVGVPEGLRERFSGRHAQVQAAIAQRLQAKTAQLARIVSAGGTDAAVAAEQLEVLEKSGRLLPAEERSVAMQSRAGKDAGLVTAGDLDWSWWQDAQAFGFDGRSVQALRGGRQLEPLSAEQLDQRVLARLTEFDAVFTDRDVRAAALVAGVGRDVQDALGSVGRLAERGELVRLADGRLTTTQHRRKEGRVAHRAQAVAAGEDARPVDGALAEQEIAVLGERLRSAGGQLAAEQAQAIRVACSDRQLVVVVGQAGTGKSTALSAIARAHEAAGQRVIVTSTGALAAERLADELFQAGVEAKGFSTAALHAQLRGGRLELSPAVTVIHDEAALASTHEQDWLFAAVETSGARLISVGDPRQSQAVGAGGLWGRIEQAARDHGGYVELARIVRARDPADRRDQSLWRAGQHERALAGYATRGRLIVEAVQQAAEDRALEAAQADRQAGCSTMVIAQTSNEHLDALNARAQALRGQAGELGDPELALVWRPYGLRAGDEIQVRHPIAHPDLGRINNGTTAVVVDVDPGGQTATLRLGDGREAVFERGLLDAGQTRLSYVQHPFPAQGATSDTTHVICGEYATAEGSYVALTRARRHSHLYVGRDRLQLADGLDVAGGGDGGMVAAVAERLGRSEPEIPSIALPLAHEQHVAVELDRASQPDVREPDPVGGKERVDLDERVPEASSPAAAGPARGEISGFEQRRARRDRLRAVLDTYPADVARRVEALRVRARQALESAVGDERRAEHWQQAYDELGVLGRRGREGRDCQERAQRLAEQAGEHRQAGEQLLAEARALTVGPVGPQAWQQDHPGVWEELYAAEQALAEAVQERALVRERGQRPGRLAGGVGEEVRWLGAERDRLAEELGCYPAAEARAVEQAERRAQQAFQERLAAKQHAHWAECELSELGSWARRGQQAAWLRQRIDHHRQHAERLQAQEREQHDRAQVGRERPGGPAEWERAHPGVRDRLGVYEHAYGQAELQHTAELITQATQARPHAEANPFVRALGPHPEEPERRQTWLQAARAIADYRTTYHIADQDPAGVLGAEPDRAQPGGFTRHQAWTQTVHEVLVARQALKVNTPARGLGLERAREVRDRGVDRGPGFEI